MPTDGETRPARPRSTLTRLADAAVTAVHDRFTGTGSRLAVGVVRGVDRSSRTRGELLRRKLRARGINAVDVLAQPSSRAREHAHRSAGADGGGDAATYAALVDVTGHGHHEADRLAARSGVPLVSLHDPERRIRTGAGIESLPIIEFATATTGPSAGPKTGSPASLDNHATMSREVALRELVISPAQPDTCRLSVRVTCDSGAPSSPQTASSVEYLPVGATVTVTLTPTALHVKATSIGRGLQEWIADTVSIEPVWGPHSVTRDGAPIADLPTQLSARHRPAGLHRRLV